MWVAASWQVFTTASTRGRNDYFNFGLGLPHKVSSLSNMPDEQWNHPDLRAAWGKFILRAQGKISQRPGLGENFPSFADSIKS